MGKGDKKSRRGKITMGTYGVRRPRKKKKNTAVITKTKPKATAKKTPAKKAPAKKTKAKKAE